MGLQQGYFSVYLHSFEQIDLSIQYKPYNHIVDTCSDN